MSLGTPWQPRTRQQEGLASERRQARKRGKRIHPGSGSGKIKRDASDDETIEEYKLANKTFTLKGDELKAAALDAVIQGKESVWVIEFSGVGIEVEIRTQL